jgi:hypothetical protein
MMRWTREHGLGIVMFSFFFVFLVGQSMAGLRHYNEEQESHGEPTISYGEYVTSGDFVESTFENWESEFLQMGAYVLLTVFLYQKGSAESKKLQGSELVDAEPRNTKRAAWPIRWGGIWQKLYENSLSIAFLLLFLMSFWLHAAGGSTVTCEESLTHGEPDCPSISEYMGTSKFWYESFQNWQSEFLAVGSIVVLSVYLRQRGSPESKPVNAPNDKTGTE